MVSKGWRRDLAQTDASAEARLFLSPSTASDEDGDEADSPPPRPMVADTPADERRRRCLCPFPLAVTPGKSPTRTCGLADLLRPFDAAEALPTKHNTRQVRTLRLIGVIVANQGCNLKLCRLGPTLLVRTPRLLLCTLPGQGKRTRRPKLKRNGRRAAAVRER